MFDLIEALKRELIVIFFSMMPISELRGAIPIGISLGLSPIHSTLISMGGNILIVPLLLKLLHPLMECLEKTYFFKNTVGWARKRAISKAKEIKAYSLIGLFLFVAVPLPTTGAWTASIIATILKLDNKKAFIAISLGIIMAGIIVLALSFGAVQIFD